MKKIKDMTENELNRLIAEVVYSITDPLKAMCELIGEHFEKIEQKLQQEIEYPNAYKLSLIEEINKLKKEIDKFLDKAKEIKRKEKKGATHD